MFNISFFCLLAMLTLIGMPAKASSSDEEMQPQSLSFLEDPSKALDKNKLKGTTSIAQHMQQSNLYKLNIPVTDAETPCSRVLSKSKMPTGFNVDFFRQGTRLLTPFNIPPKATQQSASDSLFFDVPINIKIGSDDLPELTTEESDLEEEGEEKRTHVTKTKKIPYRMHGHMMMKFSKDDKWCTGSGTLVGPYHVLTAGHNIYSHERGGWAVEVNFIPGLNGNEIPYTRARAVRLLSLEGWVKNKDSNHDMAMVILDRAVGKETGWFGLFSGTDNDLISLPSIHVTGYPALKGEAHRMSTRMWTMEGSVVPPIKAERLYYKIITTRGQSGASIWTILQEEEYYTLGIHTNGIDSKSEIRANSGTRLIPSKFYCLLKWLNGKYSTGLTEQIHVKKWNPEKAITQEDLKALACYGIKGLDFTSHYLNPQELNLLLQDQNLCLLKAKGCTTFPVTPDMQFMPTLKVLELPDSKLKDNHLSSLLRNNKLLKLDLSGNSKVKSQHMGHFRQNKTLIVLNLSRTKLDDNGLESLAKNRSLKKLNLSETQITDKGISYLIKAIEKNKSTLLSLNLTRNTFSDSTKNKLKKLKNKNPDLKIKFDDESDLNHLSQEIPEGHNKAASSIALKAQPEVSSRRGREEEIAEEKELFQLTEQKKPKRKGKALNWEAEEDKTKPTFSFKRVMVCGTFIILLLSSCSFIPWVAILYPLLFSNNLIINAHENDYRLSTNFPIVTPSIDCGISPYNAHFLVNNENYRQNSTSNPQALKNLNLRSWKNVTNITPVYYLEARVNHFIESIPEHSEESYLTEIWKIFHKPSSMTDPYLSNQVTIAGMGGVGKSSLSLSYAYEALKYKAYNIIYWLHSETETSLIQSYKKLLKAINIPFEDNAPDENIIELIKQHIPSKGNSLLIYDNVPEPGFLTERIPASADILVTSRCEHGWLESHIINLDVFRPEEAVKYLFDRTNINRTEENTYQALDLAEALGCLPLALSHAAGYISYVNTDNRYGFNDYLKAFEQEPGTHFSTHVNPFSLEKNQSISHEHLISRTWSLAGKVISPFAKELMIYFAYLEPDQIMSDYFLNCANNKKDLREAFAQLTHFSLIRGGHSFYSIHRLAQLVIRHQQETLHFESLKCSLEKSLSSFENYRQIVEQELKEEAALTKLNSLATSIRAVHINTVTLFNHLQRIARKKKDEDFFPLKFEALGLQYLVNNSTSIKVKNQIYKLLKGEELDEQEVNEKEIAIRNELTRKDIFLPEQTIKKLFKDLSLILPFDLNSTHLNYLIDTIEKINNPLERKEFIEAITGLLNNNTDNIKVLYPLPYDQVKTITNFLCTLSVSDMKGRKRMAIIDAFIAIAPEDRADIIKYLPSLWDEKMIEFDKAEIIKSIVKVPAKERKEFISYMHDLYPKNINEHDTHNVIDALALVPNDQRLEMTKIVTPLLHQKMRGRDIAFIILSLAKIAADQRSEIIRYILPFWNEETEGGELAEIINCLAQFAIEERAELVSLITHLLNKDPLLKNKVNGFIIAGIINSVKQVPIKQRLEIIRQSITSYTQQKIKCSRSMSVEEHDIFMRYLYPLCPKEMPFDHVINLARVFIKVNPGEREDITRYLSILWNDNMSILEKEDLIGILAGLDRKEREAFPLLWDREMTHYSQQSVLTAYFTIDRREYILKYLPSLWDDNMSNDERVKILAAVSKTDSNEREDVLKYAPSLWNDHMNGYERSAVMKFLSGIDWAQRRTLVQLFQVHVKDVNKNDWLKILSKLKEIPQEKRIQVSEKFIFLWNTAKANNTVHNLSDLSKNISRNILKDGGVANLIQVVEQAGY